MNYFTRCRHTLVVLTTLFLGLQITASAQTTVYPAGTYTITVPAGVTTMQVTATGAAGGSYNGLTASAGGKGGKVVATYAVTPGSTYYIFVGAKGSNSGGAAGGSSYGGGENGGSGGNGPMFGAAGGAGSDVRTSVAGGAASTGSLNSRIVVGGAGGSGGGGGCSGSATGGNGGNPATSGSGGGSGCSQSAGGNPGTQIAGGARGGSLGTATSGALGVGGNGGYSIGPPTSSSGGSGAGGGGYYGGGGAYNGGGGGGSSYASTTGIIGSATFTNGTNTGDGEVIICFSPGAISGPSTVCPGGNIALTDPTPGGTWASSNTAAATVDPLSGTVYGISGGSTTISYVTGSCPALMTVTVASLGAITGTPSVCVGNTTNLSSTTTGGVWSSDNTAVATISGTGVVSGVAPGSANISYTAGSCAVGVAVTVGAGVAPIAGTATVCQGATTQLSSSPGGGVWSSSNTAGATVDATGLVTGASGGTVNISYILGGCSQGLAVTVTAMAPISGATTVCAGATITLSDAAPGGVWSSDNTAVATISGTTVTGVSTGSANISYTSGSCAAGIAITVSGAVSPISGPPNMCVGSTVVFSSSPGGGVWSSSNTSSATIDATGQATGVATGTTFISYASGACVASMSVSIITITPITGPTTVCPGGSTITLSNASAGGVWSSDNTAAATISASGVVTGVAAGTTNISYVIGTCFTVSTIVVDILPPITGITTVCPGSTTSLSTTASGGAWSSDNTTVATVTGAGVVSGITSGTANISYTVGSCATDVAVLVNALPAIAGTTTLCTGSTITLSNASTGGVWSSTNTAIATVDPSSGVVTGVSSGGASISYTLGACSVGIAVTVSGALGPISGATSLCAGATTPLSNATGGGVWTSDNPGVAAVSGSGVVTGVAAGTANISYAAGGCTVGITITVNALPAIAGPSSVCVGSTIQLSDAVPGGVWTSGNPGSAIVSATGVVTGVASGSTTIAYSASGCSVSLLITVGNAVAAITGPTTVCAGATITLSDPTPGGVWSSDNNAAATITAAGVVGGVAMGSANISYTLGGCAAGVAITVLPSSAGVISGQDSICKGVGHEVTLNSTVTGGVWTSSNTSRGTVDPSTGVVTGVNTGIFTITYTVTNSCGTFTATYPMYVRTPIKCATSVGTSVGTAPALMVAPNPSNGIFTAQLSSDVNEDVHIIVTNIVGEKVAELNSVTNRAIEIRLNYSPGIYLISATTEHDKYVTKVVVH